MANRKKCSAKALCGDHPPPSGLGRWRPTPDDARGAAEGDVARHEDGAPVRRCAGGVGVVSWAVCLSRKKERAKFISNVARLEDPGMKSMTEDRHA